MPQLLRSLLADLAAEGSSIILRKGNSRTAMENLSPEKILALWQSLSSSEQRRLVVEDLRDTLSPSPLYREMAAVTPNYWELLSSSFARAIPMSWVARYSSSCTPADLYEIRRKQEAGSKQQAAGSSLAHLTAAEALARMKELNRQASATPESQSTPQPSNAGSETA